MKLPVRQERTCIFDADNKCLGYLTGTDFSHSEDCEHVTQIVAALNGTAAPQQPAADAVQPLTPRDQLKRWMDATILLSELLDILEGRS